MTCQAFMVESGSRWNQLLGVGCVAGVGFTVSLFVADLAYSGRPVLGRAALLGVFVASILSSVIGLGVLNGVRTRGGSRTRKDS